MSWSIIIVVFRPGPVLIILEISYLRWFPFFSVFRRMELVDMTIWKFWIFRQKFNIWNLRPTSSSKGHIWTSMSINSWRKTIYGPYGPLMWTFFQNMYIYIYICTIWSIDGLSTRKYGPYGPYWTSSKIYGLCGPYRSHIILKYMQKSKNMSDSHLVVLSDTKRRHMEHPVKRTPWRPLGLGRWVRQIWLP